MKTPKEILTNIDLSSLRTEAYSVIENMQKEAYNQAVIDCSESAEVGFTSDIERRIYFVDKQSILKNLKT